MRSKQTLLVINEETLAFTPSEAVALFESYDLSGEQAGIALDHTHGRAAALDGVAALLGKSESSTENLRSRSDNGGRPNQSLS
jgi:ATP/maltotriose-dependent transcriptional regulator MalT